MKRILAGLMCVLIVLSLCGCDDGLKIKHNPTNKEAKSAKEIIAFYSRIKIPENATLIFYYYYSCFQGSEQDQYTVFLFEDECAEWLAENNFNKEKKHKLQNIKLKQYINIKVNSNKFEKNNV